VFDGASFFFPQRYLVVLFCPPVAWWVPPFGATTNTSLGVTCISMIEAVCFCTRWALLSPFWTDWSPPCNLAFPFIAFFFLNRYHFSFFPLGRLAHPPPWCPQRFSPFLGVVGFSSAPRFPPLVAFPAPFQGCEPPRFFPPQTGSWAVFGFF